MTTETTKLTAIDILEAARELIAEPEHWLQGDVRARANNRPVGPNHPLANKFTLTAAIERVTSPLDRQAINKAVHALSIAMQTLGGGAQAFSDYNNTHTHAEILRLLDAAIVELREAK